MNSYNYEIAFKDNIRINFNSDADVDLNEITGGYMSFDDLFINLTNVLYIKKKEAEE